MPTPQDELKAFNPPTPEIGSVEDLYKDCLLYTSPSPRD